MNPSLLPNTQAVLLLTAPLIAGREHRSSDLLTSGEYRRLARYLHNKQRQPADLLAPNADELIGEIQTVMDGDRLRRLLARGFLLSQSLERWQTRAIWVVSRADAGYPRRLKSRLRDDAPPILYGCGDAGILETGGLAVVGSRDVDDGLVEYTQRIARLSAIAGRTVVSGGARGIDQAAMRGALDAGGKAAGVLADSLERAALNREHRSLLMEGRLVLISPYDPSAGFNVGHAMRRNKLIYALADAALVVNSDYERGGTWAGALEQLEKLRLVPVYVRSNGESSKGLEALRRKGALPWPNPETPEVLTEALAVNGDSRIHSVRQQEFPFLIRDEPKQVSESIRGPVLERHAETPGPLAQALTPADELFAKVRDLLQEMTTSATEAEVAATLQVSKTQARDWLQRLVKEGIIQKLSRPVRYQSVVPRTSTFDRKD